MIPGEELSLGEHEFIYEIGKYFILYQHEQRKRLILVQAYNELRQELDSIKTKDVIQEEP